MLINIRWLQGRAITLEVQSTDTIQSVKKKIQDSEGIQTDLQRLSFGSTALDNDRTLASYGIGDNAVIHIMERAAQNTNTVAGGYEQGSALNQLSFPYGLAALDDQTVAICDWANHRIIRWRIGDINGKKIAGGDDRGDQLGQLDCPTDVLVDRATNSIIISDRGNRRIVRWSLAEGTTEGTLILEDISCWGLAIDNQGFLYISDIENHEVIRCKIEEKDITVVAGGSGRGASLKQLNEPSNICVDGEQSVYVSDTRNHRVMKWSKDAKEGTVIAEGFFRGLLVDATGNVYTADYGNHRLMRWLKGEKQGTAITVKNFEGEESNPLYQPWGLCFGQRGHLLVADHSKHRIQYFPLEAAN